MRSDLKETFKIAFQLDEGGRGGHDHKLFKKRFRLNVRKI